MSDERPDYVPAWWWRYRINHRFWSSPRRVLIALILIPAGFAVVAIIAFVAGTIPAGIAAAALAVVNGSQTVTYAPRARAAMRRGAPANPS